jgi:3-hydroxyisobutyrate dehydrogenase-like beta-hydroxyacid dehydrogenase
MTKLGFIGLGIMGMPMARHLLEAGHEVALWSHNAEKPQSSWPRGKQLLG